MPRAWRAARTDRKSTRLNSSHLVISYAVFCLKKKQPERSLGESWPSPQRRVGARAQARRHAAGCRAPSIRGVRSGRPNFCPIPFLFFNDTATTEIYTLSLHDALPI